MGRAVGAFELAPKEQPNVGRCAAAVERAFGVFALAPKGKPKMGRCLAAIGRAVALAPKGQPKVAQDNVLGQECPKNNEP